MKKEDYAEMMTISEMCDHLKIDRKKAYRLIQEPGFPVVKIGREYRILKKPYLEWLEDQLVNN